jgi:hypothetical protein
VARVALGAWSMGPGSPKSALWEACYGATPGGFVISQIAVSGQLRGHRSGGIDLSFVRVADKPTGGQVNTPALAAVKPTQSRVKCGGPSDRYPWQTLPGAQCDRITPARPYVGACDTLAVTGAQEIGECGERRERGIPVAPTLFPSRSRRAPCLRNQPRLALMPGS